MNNFIRIAACCAASILAACASPAGGLSLAPGVPAASTHGRIPSGSLYVASAFSVAIYAPGADSPSASITRVAPVSIAFDKVGNFYVGNVNKFGNDVVEYRAGGTTVARKISKGVDSPRALAFDSTGKLYVANLKATPPTVTIYSSGPAPVRTITQGLSHPGEFAFNKQGDLYVGNVSDDVTEYAPGSSSVLLTIHQGIGGPLAIFVDLDGNLCAVNNFNVTTYAPGSSTVLHKITKGIIIPSTLAFDGAGNMYVANWGPNSSSSTITVYARGTLKLLRTISDGVSDPSSLAFDKQGNLYVANYAGNDVTVYVPGKTRPSHTISEGIAHPLKIAFSP